MISNLIPSEATHSSLDFIKKLPLFVFFENTFTQKIGPSYSLDGSMREFEVLGDRINFIDLQRICLEIVARIVASIGTLLRTQIRRSLLTILYLHFFFLNVHCLRMVRKYQPPTLILPIKALLRPSFHTAMMPRKHAWLFKVILMKKTHQQLTVMEKELTMLRSVSGRFGLERAEAI